MPPAAKQVVSPQAACIVTDILAGNTNKNVNPFWGKFAINGPRRPPAGDAQDRHEQRRQGPQRLRLHRPADARPAATAGAYALAVGVWNGNSDNSLVSTPAEPVFSIDVSTYVWQGFLQEASAQVAGDQLRAADGLVKVAIDPFTGLLATSGDEVGQRVVHRRHRAAATRSRPTPAASTSSPRRRLETRFDAWMAADRDWIRRAQRGPGTAGGPERTRTAYFYNGAFQPVRRVVGRDRRRHGCGQPSPSPTCFPLPTPDAERRDPVIRGPVADRLRVRRAPLPARHRRRRRRRRRMSARRRSPTPPKPSRRRRSRRRRRTPTPDADADPDAHADTDADADAEHRRRTRRRRRLGTGGARRPVTAPAVTATPPGAIDGGHRRPRSRRPARRPDDPRPARLDGPRRRALGRPRARTARARRRCCRSSG